MRARFFAFLLLALPVLSFPEYKPWYNFYNFAYGAKAQAMGNAFTAVADDLTAAFWNPAGLFALRDPEFYLGYRATSQWHEYDLQEKEIANDIRLYNFNFRSRLNQIDFFSISAPAPVFKRPWTFVLSYYRYIPYGFKGTVQETLTSLKNRFETQKTEVTFTGSEGFDVLAFSASASLTDYFSLGATLQQFFGSGGMHQAIVSPEGESHSQLTEKLQGRNTIVGMLLSPFQFLRLGLTWHSGLKSRFDSDLLTWDINKKGTKFNERQDGCQARVVIPEQYSFGLLLRPAAWLDVGADYSLIEWDKGTIEGYYDSTLMPYPQMDAWSLGQKQIRNLRFGAEARVPFQSWLLSLRGGWSLDRQLYADESDTPVKIKSYAAGVGCEFSRNFLVEVTYQRQKAEFQENGRFGILRLDVDTHYRANVFFLALTYRFGHIFKE